ncbi:MAG: hypothetical protein J6C03_05160 [Clostridia bacterium]|nr:hypothetical protein [Clostridia bacterium]
MKRILCLLLAAIMMLSLAACAGDGEENKETEPEETVEQKSNKVNAELKDVYAALDAEIGFEEKILEVVYMAEDEEEFALWNYGVDPEVVPAFESLTDYALTVPTDYCHTFAAFVFDRELTADEISAIKAKVKEDYLELQASSLQMYMPEEYAKMAWACENEDLIWREYDNALVMIITDDEEAKDAFEVFEKEALK